MKSPFKKSSTQKPEEIEEHGWKDRTSRFAIDFLLRKNGYTIYARNKLSEPEWIRAGEVYLQSEAIREINWSELQDALYEEDLHFMGYE